MANSGAGTGRSEGDPLGLVLHHHSSRRRVGRGAPDESDVGGTVDPHTKALLDGAGTEVRAAVWRPGWRSRGRPAPRRRGQTRTSEPPPRPQLPAVPPASGRGPPRSRARSPDSPGDALQPGAKVLAGKALGRDLQGAAAPRCTFTGAGACGTSRTTGRRPRPRRPCQRRRRRRHRFAPSHPVQAQRPSHRPPRTSAP